MTILHILIPAFNAGKYIKETLDSIRDQGISSLVVTVIDNFSTDNTLEIVEGYFEFKVNVVKNSYNIGSLANHNLALALGDGDYIKILSSDDVLAPGSLAKQISALNLNPDCVLSTCNYIITDLNLNPLGKGKYLSGHRLGMAAIEHCLTSLNNLIGCPSSVMLRRSAIKNIRFDITFPWMGDLLFYCSVLEHGNFINIDEEGFYYRTHPHSDSVLGCTPWIRIKDEFRVLVKLNNFNIKNIRILSKRFLVSSLLYGYKWLQRLFLR